MSLAYIRERYGVPAKRFALIRFEGRVGTIVGARGPHLRVRFGGESRAKSLHPTWNVEYLGEPATVGPSSRSARG